jgi:hypothetical protein
MQIGKCHSDEYPNTEGRETEKKQIGAVSEEADGAQASLCPPRQYLGTQGVLVFRPLVFTPS